uniref:Replication associated protein n=1 Tax=Barley dwarf virus TaxID=497862 RepID=B7ZFT2_9GEMI|nr:replication associated protein [Barley dwarf virus]
MASSSAPRFRVYSKYLFLTYPQCILEPQYMYSNAVIHYMYEGESFFAFGENVTASQ